MVTWQARKRHNKRDVFSSEIRLRECSQQRRARVEKLLSLLEKEGFDERISGTHGEGGG